MRHFRRHADALAQRGVWLDGPANIHGVRAHLNRQRNFANHVTGVPAYKPVRLFIKHDL